ncbi:MAG: hypothetical protein M3Z85_14995, partial [Acidobacteriota bacterium]|nr:hypothetical protein [Acidobacteriota bacterium]
FQVALWTHAYKWTDSPDAQHEIVGLTPETHGRYCRDAMAMLLKEVPEIDGVTLRVHGESGIPEGSTGFWREVFDGIIRGGRRTSIDMHAKGLDQTMMELALQTGLPVSISPKYWAEHMGLGYHQAAIRELEMPRAQDDKPGIFQLSEGSRRFLRYGYGDLFKAGRRYDVMFRMWPGTQRLLIWGDPATAAAYGRESHFCGASGVEICEPLFFKGRQGSGLPGGRCAYADESLKPKLDFEKYLYTYRVWGRLLYNPEADPESWRRYLRTEFGAGAAQLEDAVTHGSRVLPLFTTARLPSASNLGCWPEMYTNMPIVEGSEPSPYGDTAVPKRLGTVSPLDPQLFSTVEEYVTELLNRQRSGKYSPVEVAQWLEDTSAAAVRALSLAAGRVPARKAPEFRRIEEDVLIEAGMGQFFAAQIRSAVLFDSYRRTGDRAALDGAISAYRKARSAWASMAERARGVYRADVTFGDTSVRRGHWIDRLTGIDRDLAAMEGLVKGNDSGSTEKADAAIREAIGRPNRISAPCGHNPPSAFRPGDPIPLSIQLPPMIHAASLQYRHVDQAERWQRAEMRGNDRGNFAAEIPGDYSNSPFALEYYFELRRDPAVAWLYPGFNADLTNQPYFVIPRAS